jgi:hypothetical protein
MGALARQSPGGHPAVTRLPPPSILSILTFILKFYCSQVEGGRPWWALLCFRHVEVILIARQCRRAIRHNMSAMHVLITQAKTSVTQAMGSQSWRDCKHSRFTRQCRRWSAPWVHNFMRVSSPNKPVASLGIPYRILMKAVKSSGDSMQGDLPLLEGRHFGQWRTLPVLIWRSSET